MFEPSHDTTHHPPHTPSTSTDSMTLASSSSSTLSTPSSSSTRRFSSDRSSSSTFIHFHSSNSPKIHHPLIPPMFREITSIPTIAMQLVFGVLCGVVLCYMLPHVFERVWISGYSTLFAAATGDTFSKNNSCRNEIHCNLEFISQLLIMSMMLFLVYENFLNCVTPTLIRFTLAGHSFRNSKTNSVNTNQFLTAHYPRYLVKLFLFPFSIFLCSVVWTIHIFQNEETTFMQNHSNTENIITTDTLSNNGSLYRMACFIISLTIAFKGVNEFVQTFFNLQYELDLISQYIYVRVQKKAISSEQAFEISENDHGEEPVTNWSFLLSLIIPFMTSVYLLFHSESFLSHSTCWMSQQWIGTISLLLGCVTLILENFSWPFSFLEHNLKIVFNNLGNVAFVWGLEIMLQLF
ncbi:hypothetical protein C9374_005969 [Naegleria lovaniensis]|uniref:Uncharacterized protein n=1 Tax=Naegleria lovaniensis TaxID=51637 RepID=A0AA88GPB9_NAELO|nr:uncharacterized protein C9374_005969 [Naegleria lovaniensis]KAG2381585.1 hypothetical protein C9374_005969 [Naegleria lovaniensis]